QILEVAIMVAVAVEGPPETGALELPVEVIEVRWSEPGRKRIGIGQSLQQAIGRELAGGPASVRRIAAQRVIEAPQRSAHIRLTLPPRQPLGLKIMRIEEPATGRE